MSLWDVHDHYSTKYKLQAAVKLHNARHSLGGPAAYNFPTSYSTSFASHPSPFKSLQYLNHFIFITLIVVDLIYKYVDSHAPSSSTLTLTIFVISFVVCILLNGFALIASYTKKNSITKEILIPFCQRFVSILFTFTILTILFYISVPLLLYLCAVYIIFSNPIPSIVEYLMLHDILNMKNMQIDYNFIAYNPMSIDNPDYNAIYQYLFTFVLINYESSEIAKQTHSKASAQCIQHCHEILSARAGAMDRTYHDEFNHSLSIANINLSNDVDRTRFITQSYMKQHMVRDIVWMSIVALFISAVFWCNFYLSEIESSSYYAITYSLYALLCIVLVVCRLFEIETKLKKQMGWLQRLYFADYMNINDMNYVKFMYLYCDILTIAPSINAIIDSLDDVLQQNDRKCARIVMDYLYNIRCDDAKDIESEWIGCVIRNHYFNNYHLMKAMLPFNSSHWMSLKVQVLGVEDLRYQLMDHKIYAKVKMIKPHCVNHVTYTKYNYRKNEDMKRHTIDDKNGCDEWLFSLKFTEISLAKFVISIISECRDIEETDYDDVIGLTQIDLKHVFNGAQVEPKRGIKVHTVTDLYCKNEESGAMHIEFEVLEFNPMYHMDVDDETYGSNQNHELQLMDANDATVPLIIAPN